MPLIFTPLTMIFHLIFIKETSFSDELSVQGPFPCEHTHTHTDTTENVTHNSVLEKVKQKLKKHPLSSREKF